MAEKSESDQKVEDTASSKLAKLRRRKLHEYDDYFSTVVRTLGDANPEARRMARAASDRLGLIRGELNRRDKRKNTWIAVAGLCATIAFGIERCRPVASTAPKEQAVPSATTPTTNSEPLASSTNAQ